jgi:hypothetical protein
LLGPERCWEIEIMYYLKIFQSSFQEFISTAVEWNTNFREKSKKFYKKFNHRPLLFMSQYSATILQYYYLTQKWFHGTIWVSIGEPEWEIRKYQSGDPIYRAIWRFQDQEGYPLMRSQKDSFFRQWYIYIDSRKPMQFGPEWNTRTHRAIRIATFLQKTYREFWCELHIQSWLPRNQRWSVSIWIGDNFENSEQFNEFPILSITPYVTPIKIFDSEWTPFWLLVEDLPDFIDFLSEKITKNNFHKIFPRFLKK